MKTQRKNIPAFFTLATSPTAPIYAHVIPSKALLKSTLIYEVIMRGDLFAMNMDTHDLTIISGDEELIEQRTLI